MTQGKGKKYFSTINNYWKITELVKGLVGCKIFPYANMDKT